MLFNFCPFACCIAEGSPLHQAVTTHRPAEGPAESAIVRSDRRSQYTSHEYREQLIKQGIQQSFSAKGCPYDNALNESFHALLKKELVYRTIFTSYEDAKP
ncbi:integrase core domain-containing protein [Sulfoacidibacillus thermotolerans]|uniref:Integrase catalytic domain-containing protein n=1 Tax=Sulfoacidibacillus thermotolerans TaxID=1765684 RepID=A0A2U3D623_SULT2|nr:integrase core domain-containing protein [Sulfoacidibacillus thermotolerans]PWI56735.1 hypothetical protein BM613_12230 [Sulfoacidibacillus thermotolerans]